MKRFNQGQKFTVLGTAVLLLTSFLFPPWISRLSLKGFPTFESEGYRFILAPPGGFAVSIDLWRLVIQSLIIMLAGFIGFCLFAWRTPRDTSKPSTQPVLTPKNIDNSDSRLATSSRFKTREEYERWKNERLQLLPKKDNAGTIISKKHEPGKIPVGWLKFYNYCVIPGGILRTLVITPLPLGYWSNIMFTIGLTWSILLGCLFYGLYKKRLWGWKLNWILLVIGVLLTPLEYEKGAVFYFVGLVSGGLIWFLPNYIYFKKRRALFL